MAIYRTEIIRREAAAEGTLSVYLKKPAEFTFVAGQFLEFLLLNPPETDGEGNQRAFSIAAAPSESDLMITTRLRDTAFKRNLQNLPLGTVVQIEGPFGALTLHHDTSRPAVFLAGGIGITPFRSIILDAAERHLSHELYLFYSNRRPEDSAFLDELSDLETKNSHYHCIVTMTEMEKSTKEWTGETGYIDAALLQKYLSDPTAAVYYLAGPPAMVAAMHKLTETVGADPDRVKIEEFAGY